MTNDKIKITRGQEKAIKHLLNSYSKEEIIDYHAIKMNAGQGKEWNAAINQPLNDLPQSVLAIALLIGYDVEPEYKVGECIKYRMGTNSYNYGKFVRKEEHKIWAYWGESKSVTWVSEKDVEKCTPEDIKAEKERQLWAKIGREVGEFKEGDVGSGEHGYLFMEESLKEGYKYGRLKGFYPAESFVSFEEGEEE